MDIPTQHFEQHLSHVSEHGGNEWLGPLADVLDTAYAVHLWSIDHDLEGKIDLAGLTKLVLERHDQGLL